MKSIRAGILAEFTPEETMKAVQGKQSLNSIYWSEFLGIQKYGTKWGTVACLVGREPTEVEQFYHKYKGKYRLDVVGLSLSKFDSN